MQAALILFKLVSFPFHAHADYLAAPPARNPTLFGLIHAPLNWSVCVKSQARPKEQQLISFAAVNTQFGPKSDLDYILTFEKSNKIKTKGPIHSFHIYNF